MNKAVLSGMASFFAKSSRSHQDQPQNWLILAMIAPTPRSRACYGLAWVAKTVYMANLEVGCLAQS